MYYSLHEQYRTIFYYRVFAFSPTSSTRHEHGQMLPNTTTYEYMCRVLNRGAGSPERSHLKCDKLSTEGVYVLPAHALCADLCTTTLPSAVLTISEIPSKGALTPNLTTNCLWKTNCSYKIL